MFNAGYTQAPFYFGVDLSYGNEIEDCGAVYTINNVARDPFEIFNVYGTNLVRLRLWHTPDWYDDLNQGRRYSDIKDVVVSIQRAKAESMDVLLDFHLSDTWADPGRQLAPKAWIPVLDDVQILKDSLYNYIYSTLHKLAVLQILPEIVQIGNETNKGILLSAADNQGWVMEWPRNSILFNAAIEAVRDIETEFNQEIKIALHIANPSEVGWLIDEFVDHGVTDFDIIGISYYYQYHFTTIEETGDVIAQLKELYPDKEILILETAYPWTVQNADSAPNVLNGNYPGFSNASPANQKEFMVQLTQEVIDNGGIGVVYWEPAWVSTGCETQWAYGSHWDNATFFDFDNELIEEGGIGWMMYPYDFTVGVDHSLTHDNLFKVYFNGNQISIEIDSIYLNEEFEIVISSVDGKEMYRNIDPSGNNGPLNLIPGCYVVVVYYKGGRSSRLVCVNL